MHTANEFVTPGRLGFTSRREVARYGHAVSAAAVSTKLRLKLVDRNDSV